MKTYIKTTWNWFRLLALGSILVCANSYRANAATTPTITYGALQPINYGTALGSAQFSAHAVDPVTLASLDGAGAFTYRVNGQAVFASTPPLLANATGYTIYAEFTPFNSSLYNNATNSQTLVVNRLELVLNVGAPSRYYGEANPPFTASWLPASGPVNGEITASLTCPAVPSSPVGTYTISASINDPQNKGANYIITATNALLSVNPAPITITPIARTIPYGTSNFITTTDPSAYTVTLPSSLVYRDDLSNIKAQITLYSTSNPTNTFLHQNMVKSCYPQAGTYYYLVDYAVSKAASSGFTAGNLAANGKDGRALWDGVGAPIVNPNYTVVSNASPVVVQKVQMNLTAFTQTQQYGNIQNFTGTITGVVKAPDVTANTINVSGINGVVTSTSIQGFDDNTNLTFTWSSVSSNAPPGVYNLTPSVTETVGAPGRLFNNYDPIVITPGVLTIIKRVPSVTWNIAPSDQILTYGQTLSGSQLNASINNKLTGVYTNISDSALSYSPALGSLVNAGNNTLTATITPTGNEATYWDTATFTRSISVAPFPTTMSWTGAKTSDGDMKGYIPSIAYGTPLSATQLAAVTQGATNAGATSPGAVSYNVLGYNTSGGTTVGTAFPLAGPDGYNLFPVATYPSPLTGATPAAWILEAKAAANQNYGSVTQKVNLVVTNGVFDVASPAVSDMQSTPNLGPSVNLSFSGVAKIGSASAAASTKITVSNGLYYSSSAATAPALIYAFLVNTNADVNPLSSGPIIFSPTEPGADGTFTLVPSTTVGPSAPSGMIPESFYYGRGLPKGTNFELRVYYPDAYIKLPGNPSTVVQASALNARTNFYKVTVGVLNTDITVNSDNSDKNYTYGSTDTISFPVSVKFRSGSGDLTGKAVHVEFNGAAQPDLTLSAPVSGVYSATFTFTLPNRADYTVFHGPYAAKFTLDSAGDAYNGSTKSINVNFTRRDLHVHVSPTDTATVIYGENSDSAAYANPSYKAYANSYITPADIVSGDIISAANILPSIITTATGPNATIPFTVGQVNWNGTGADSRDAFNYNVVKVDGTMKILRRTVTIAVGSVTAITNVAADVSGDWTVSNWAPDGGSKSLVKAFGNGKIELQTSRVLNSPVGSQWYITNKWGAQVLALPGTPSVVSPTPITILTNYSEVTDVTTDLGTTPYSFYVDGPLGTNYFVKTAPHYNILTVIGIMPTVTWVTTNMTYGDSFSANNVLTAVVKTNGVVDSDPLTLSYEAVQNDVNGGGYVGIGTSGSSFKIPMATSSLGLKLTYVSKNPNVAKLDDAMAPKATATVAVNKAGLFVTAKQATAVKYNDATPAGWGISFDINGILNGDPISGGARAIFARDPLATGTMNKFANSVVTTNGANILSPVGSYPITSIVSDTGFNAPSNYNVVYIQGTYTVTGAIASGGPAGWVETVDNGTVNIVRTYGWYFKNNDLIDYIKDTTAFPAFSPLPGAGGRDNDAYKQFTITVGSDSAPANQSAVADGTLLPAGTNTIIFKYSYSDAYSPLYKTNKLQVRRYPINMVVRWDAGVGAQVQRAYRDYFTFPVLWDGNGTNFGTNIAGPYTNFATFNAGALAGTPDSRWSVTNGLLTVAPPLGTIVKYLTNGAGLPTNLMFATTNDTLDVLGIQLAAGAADSPIGTYPVTASITSASKKDNYTLTVGTSGAATVQVTNATLKFVVQQASRAYGSQNPTFSGTVNAVKSNGTTEYANVDGIYMTFTNYTTTNSVVGTSPIYSFVNDPNFKSGNYNPDMSSSIGVLTITNAMLTVAPVPYPKAFRLRPGQAKPTFTSVTPTGFVNGQDSTVITTWPTWDSAYTPAAAVGATFDITNKTAGVAPNYAFTYIKGSVVVSSNLPPVGMSDVITVANTNVTKILVTKLLANDVSPFGDVLTMDMTEFAVGRGKNSSRGINIQTDNTKLWLYYNTAALALDTTPGSYDTFTYTVMDALTPPAKGVGTVFVKVSTANPNYVPNNIVAAQQDPLTGAITLTFLGISGRSYNVQGTSDLLRGTWVNLALYDRNVFPNLTGATTTTTFTCVNGVIKATDPDAGTVGNRFYRAITPQ